MKWWVLRRSVCCMRSRARCSRGYITTGSLPSSIALARADGSQLSLARKLEKTDLLVPDNWGLYLLEPDGGQDIFEILHDRSGIGTTTIASQLPVSILFDAIAAPTIADAILDRLAHGAYRIEMTGESMRKKLATLTDDAS